VDKEVQGEQSRDPVRGLLAPDVYKVFGVVVGLGGKLERYFLGSIVLAMHSSLKVLFRREVENLDSRKEKIRFDDVMSVDRTTKLG
jgi:hypothetical protein